jgi:hypothetical protein
MESMINAADGSWFLAFVWWFSLRSPQAGDLGEDKGGREGRSVGGC